MKNDGKRAAFQWTFSESPSNRLCRHEPMNPCGGEGDQMSDKLAACRDNISKFRAAAENARNSQGDEMPRHCLAVGLFRSSDSHPTPSSPFTRTAMISQFSALLLRRRCVAPLTRSQMLRMPAVASRTPGVTKARVSIEDTRIWHLTVVSLGLLSMVL